MLAVAVAVTRELHNVCNHVFDEIQGAIVAARSHDIDIMFPSPKVHFTTCFCDSDAAVSGQEGCLQLVVDAFQHIGGTIVKRCCQGSLV